MAFLCKGNRKIYGAILLSDQHALIPSFDFENRKIDEFHIMFKSSQYMIAQNNICPDFEANIAIVVVSSCITNSNL